MELRRAPMTPFMDERLPGMSPLTHADWLDRDEAFAAQMAYRDRLVVDAADQHMLRRALCFRKDQQIFLHQPRQSRERTRAVERD